ncbi:hypothetical protein CYY_005855 [Polysphondylium violaceum]|uniref:AIG1-type G domain-containing protein n=1 Tax=Polysphondylium violaceum TaxID=133409 RepID=A0A8J4PUF5_9MYCE|nr:hypothetical protein CYY_005855 [Polysphondylium violaceum]
MKIDTIVVGRTGAGKSTLCNVLMDNNYFEVGHGLSSTTKSFDEKCVEYQGTVFNFIDTPRDEKLCAQKTESLFSKYPALRKCRNILYIGNLSSNSDNSLVRTKILEHLRGPKRSVFFDPSFSPSVVQENETWIQINDIIQDNYRLEQEIFFKRETKKLFNWRPQIDSIENEKIILLVGRTGSGKSTLANIITQGNQFEESGSLKYENQFQNTLWSFNKKTYLVIETPGIGDGDMKIRDLLSTISEICYKLKNGIAHIFYLSNGRFTTEDQICFKILTEVIFNNENANLISLVRTNFPGFRNFDKCKIDTDLIQEEISFLDKKKLGYFRNKVIHINNLNQDEEPSMKSRKDSREKILTLISCFQDQNSNPKVLNEFLDKIEIFGDLKIKLKDSSWNSKILKNQLGIEDLNLEIQKNLSKILANDIKDKNKPLWKIILNFFNELVENYPFLSKI